MAATTEQNLSAVERPRLLTGQSIAKNLILGEIVEENLFPYPEIRSRDREMLGQIVEAIDDFLKDKSEDFRRWDREGAQPAEFIQALRELGLFSLINRQSDAIAVAASFVVGGMMFFAPLTLAVAVGRAGWRE